MVLVVKNPPARGVGSVPGWRGTPGGGTATPLQYSFLESPTGSGAWWAAVHKAAKSQTRLEQLAHARTRPTGNYAATTLFITAMMHTMGPYGNFVSLCVLVLRL